METPEPSQKLISTFFNELEERVHEWNLHVLHLEKAPAPNERRLILDRLFRTAHSLKGASQTVHVTLMEIVSHHVEGLLSELREGTRPLDQEVLDILFRFADAIQDALARLREKRSIEDSLLSELADQFSVAPVPDRTGKFPGPEPASPGPGVIDLEAPFFGFPPPSSVSSGDRRRATLASELQDPPKPGRRTMRVSEGRVNALLDSVAELQAMAGRLTARGADLENLKGELRLWRADSLVRTPPGDPRAAHRETVLVAAEAKITNLQGALQADRGQIERQIESVMEGVCRLRLLAFAEVCPGLERVVRDVAAAAQKEVDLVLPSPHIELDRPILESLKDPLIHLLRNAIDHGIERPDEREAKGKPRRGKVTIDVSIRGNQALITVADDGAGLDDNAIRRVAAQRNLPLPDNSEEMTQLILQPGFSTSPRVTMVSGRGVGLDAVRSQIEALHGIMDVTSEPGTGTSFRLAFPLNLTQLRVLLVSVGNQMLALPTSSVVRVMHIGPEHRRRALARRWVMVDGTRTPLASLAEVLDLPLNIPGQPQRRTPLVVVSVTGETVGFCVDAVVFESVVVAKNLGNRLRMKSVSAAAILSDDTVALILNMPELIRSAQVQVSSVPAAEGVPAATAGLQKRVLVVDDSPTVRENSQHLLESAGYEVLVAGDGLEAWLVLNESSPDLVLTDVEMPRMDGLALTRSIRTSTRFGDLPVIMLTSMGTVPGKMNGMAVGADAYLVKAETDEGKILEAIEKLL